MPHAQGSRHRMAYVPETTFGTTPGTPSMVTMRVTDTSLNLTKESYQSEEIRADRAIADLRHGTRQVGGDIGFELSYGSFDTLLAAALYGSWAGDVLETGSVFQSFTFERGFMDNAQFFRYRGCAINSMSLSVPASGIVTGSFGVIGLGFSTSGTALGTPAAAATTSPLAAVNGSLQEGGDPIASVTSLEFTLENGISADFVVGSNEAAGVSSGRCNVSGSLSCYFTDMAMMTKFINEEESSLELQVADPAGNSLTFLLPRIKYSGGEVPLDGEGSLQINMPFQALYDGTTGSTMTITRDPA